MKNTLRQYVVLISVLATLVVNVLADALPINGLNTAAISDRFHVWFVPAGYVFAIWGLIYIGLIAYGIYQVLPARREDPRLRSVDGFFVLASLANILWLFLWHYELFVGTLAAMLVLLAALIAIYLRLGIGVTKASTAETWLVRVPFSVYLGWITVATIANATELLDYLKWTGFGLPALFWFLVVLLAVLVIATLMSLNRKDAAFVLVILWALAGVAYKNAAMPVLWITTLTTALLVGLGLIYSLLRRRAIAS
ncbi:MAG TPA: hypothetical protein VMC09_05865 [Anaerolineales bacterium]|nr:hypothetical protein [Anaerolineales bacterium]